MSQYFPTFSPEQWLTLKTHQRQALPFWLLCSLLLNAAVLLGFGTVVFITEEAVLPVQAGHQAINLKMVNHAATTSKTLPTKTQPQLTTQAPSKNQTAQNHSQKSATAPQQSAEKNKTAPTTKSSTQENTSVATAHLTEGVYAQATPQSANKPEYPRMAVLKNQQGKVVVKFDVDQTGKTLNIEIIKSSGYSLLDMAVVAFAQKEKFIPASQNSQPVPSTQQYAFLFKLI